MDPQQPPLAAGPRQGIKGCFYSPPRTLKKDQKILFLTRLSQSGAELQKKTQLTGEGSMER
jgi:hypothetical protein